MVDFRFQSEHQWRREVVARLDLLLRKVDDMAVSEADFDAALAAYIADVDAGVQALVAKAQSVAPAEDFSAELATITDAKSDLDASLAAANTAAPVSPVNPAEGPAQVVAVTDNNPTGPNEPDSLEQSVLDDTAATAAAQAEAAAAAPAPDPAVSEPVAVDPASQPVLVSGPQTSGIVADDGAETAEGSVAPDAGDAAEGVTEGSPPAPDAA